MSPGKDLSFHSWTTYVLKIIFNVYLFTGGPVACHSVHVEVGGQLVRAGSLLPHKGRLHVGVHAFHASPREVEAGGSL